MLQLNLACEPKQKLGRSLPRRLQICAVALLVIGIFFRFYNLDRKVYWLDEARTSLRMSGHTQTELVEEIYTGQVVDAATLQAYQRPGEKDWGDTFHALQGNAEHTPLYFLLARLWTEGWGYSVANIRGLSVFFSLLVFPCLFWLCRELFASHAVGWVRSPSFLSPRFMFYMLKKPVLIACGQLRFYSPALYCWGQCGLQLAGVGFCMVPASRWGCIPNCSLAK